MLDRALSHRKMSDALCTQSGAQGLVVSGTWHLLTKYIRNEWMGLRKHKESRKCGYTAAALDFLMWHGLFEEEKKSFPKLLL